MHEWSGTNVKKENIKPTPITNERYESLTKRHWGGGEGPQGHREITTVNGKQNNENKKMSRF